MLQILMSAIANDSPAVLLWIALSLAGGILALSASLRARAVAPLAGVAMIAIAGTVFWFGFLNPALAEEVTLRPFAQVIDHAVPAGVPINYIGMFDCDLAFYSDHEIRYSNKFQCAPQSRDEYFLVWQDRLVTMTPEQRGCLTPLAQSLPVDRHGIRVLMIEKK